MMSTAAISDSSSEHHVNVSDYERIKKEQEICCMEDDGSEGSCDENNYRGIKRKRQDESSSSSSNRTVTLSRRVSDIEPTKKKRTRSNGYPENQAKSPELVRAYERVEAAEEHEENATNVLEQARQALQEAQRLRQEAQALTNSLAKNNQNHLKVNADECPVNLIKISYLNQTTAETSCSYTSNSEFVTSRPEHNDDVNDDSSDSTSSCDSTKSGAEVSHSSFTTLMSPSDSDAHSILSSDVSCSSRDRCHAIDESVEEKRKLMRKFSIRKKEMKQVTRGFSKTYTALITSNEAHVQREAMLKYEAKNSLPTVNHQTARIHQQQANSEIGFNTKSFLSNVRENILFEVFNFVPGIIILFAYSVAHVSVCELMSHIFEAYTQELGEWSEDQFYFGILAIAFILLRLSGNIFEWISDAHFASVKFDMHNRLRMRKKDARIMLWFRRHQSIQLCMNIICLYTCFISVNHLLDKIVLPGLFDNAKRREQLIAGLPSMKYDGVSTHIKSFFLSGESQFENKAAAAWDDIDFQFNVDQCHTNNTMSTSWEHYEAFRAKLTAQDGLYLENITSVDSYYNLIGDPKAGVYTTKDAVFFFGVASIGSIIFLSRVGVGFWER